MTQLGQVDHVFEPQCRDGPLQQLPHLTCRHRAKAELQRIGRAHSRVASRHQAHGVRAAQQERGEVGGRPDVVDNHQYPAIGENSRQVEAGLLGVGERRPLSFQMHAQIGDELNDACRGAVLARFDPQDLGERSGDPVIVAGLGGQGCLPEPSRADDSDHSGSRCRFRSSCEQRDQSVEVTGSVDHARLQGRGKQCPG